jgi:cardiolipin synthase
MSSDHVRQRPDDESTRTRWRRGGAARAGRAILVIVTLALAWIGLLNLTRGTAVQQVRGVEPPTPIAVDEDGFPLAVAMLTGAPIQPDHRVEVMLNGDGTYERLWADLRVAREFIALQLYYGSPGHMARTLGDILRERLAAGVRVALLYDAFGTADIPPDQLEALRALGARVEPFRPLRISSLHLAQHRSHVRAIIIDGRVGWTGGFGIDDKWFGDGRTDGSWRETNVRFEGPAVQQLQAAFAASWAEATGILYTGRPTVTPAAESTTTAGLLYAAPTLGSTPAERFFALSIAAARKSLYITNAYFAPDQGFIELLARAAARGVDVRILTAGPRTDVPVVRLAGRSQYDRLLAAGVRIYEWQPTTLHAKTFVVDGEWSTIGSMNFDNRSMALNDEATLMVLDPAFGSQMNEIFMDDLQDAQEITPAEFSRRSWVQRLAERGAHMITRLL